MKTIPGFNFASNTVYNMFHLPTKTKLNRSISLFESSVRSNVSNPSTHLHHREGAGVPDAESLPADPPKERLAARGAKTRHVSDDHVILRNEPLCDDILRGVHGDLPPAEPLASAIVCVSLHVHEDALGEGEPKRLSRVPLQFDVDGLVRKSVLTEARRYLVGEHGTRGPVQVRDAALEDHRPAALQRVLGKLDELVVLGHVHTVVLGGQISYSGLRVELLGRREQRREIQAAALIVQTLLVHFEVLRLPNHLLHGPVTEARHLLPYVLGHKPEVIHDVLRLPAEFGAEFRILRGDSDRARVEVTLPHHDASQSDKGAGGKGELLRTQ
mmetsp:Transcript_31716/g.62844  ORF Transcript_31716/g.62844 Transcript_31716/m.62844 type:complete len:328 (-) Transcript_31716:87-1070(-)